MENKLKTNILFLCIGNSCRSQMAEGFAKFYLANEFSASSAGLRSSKLDPLAVQVMQEIGIDISGHLSKSTEDLKGQNFDFVVTVCEEGAKECPYFKSNIANIHKPFLDPPKMTVNMTMEDKLSFYRKVRDEIGKYVKDEMVKQLKS